MISTEMLSYIEHIITQCCCDVHKPVKLYKYHNTNEFDMYPDIIAAIDDKIDFVRRRLEANNRFCQQAVMNSDRMRMSELSNKKVALVARLATLNDIRLMLESDDAEYYLFAPAAYDLRIFRVTEIADFPAYKLVFINGDCFSHISNFTYAGAAVSVLCGRPFNYIFPYTDEVNGQLLISAIGEVLPAKAYYTCAAIDTIANQGLECIKCKGCGKVFVLRQQEHNRSLNKHDKLHKTCKDCSARHNQVQATSIFSS